MGWRGLRQHDWLGWLLTALVLQASWSRTSPELLLLLLPLGGFWTRIGKRILALVTLLSAVLLALKEKAALRPGRGLDLPTPGPTAPFPLEGRNVFITGSTSGIGLHAAWNFLRLGAHVGMHGSKQEKTMELAKYLLTTLSVGCPGQATPVAMDFGDFEDVRRGAVEVRKHWSELHILVLNAALTGYWLNHTHSSGNDLSISVNHLAHFLLFSLLDPLLAPKARIVITSSGGAWYGFHEHLTPTHRLRWEDHDFQRNFIWGARQAYQDSKLANVCFGRALRRRLAGHASVVIYDPAFVETAAFSMGPQSGYFKILDWSAPTYMGGEKLFQASFTSRQPVPDGVCSYWLAEEAVQWWATWHPLDRLKYGYIQAVFERNEWALYGLHGVLAPPCSEQQQEDLWRWSAERVGLHT